MALVAITVKQIVIMFLLIIVGIICFKTKILDTQKTKVLSDILIKVITPALIISSFQRKFEKDLVHGLILSLVLTVLSLSLSFALSRLLIRKNGRYDSVIDRFAVMYSNCGFMGFPLALGVLGTEGVFYLVGFNMLFDLLVFTYGESSMKGAKASGAKAVVRQMINPATVASLIGVLLFVFQLQLPELVSKPVSMIADMNTPVAMLAAGVSVAQANPLKLLKKGHLYYVCAVKLLIIPVIFTLICKLFPIPRTVLLSAVLATACPSATLTVLFSVMYGRDNVYASEVFTATTLLSVVTIPVVVAIAML